MKEIIFNEVPGHQLVSLLKMDSFRTVSEDFVYLLETPFLGSGLSYTRTAKTKDEINATV